MGLVNSTSPAFEIDSLEISLFLSLSLPLSLSFSLSLSLSLTHQPTGIDAHTITRTYTHTLTHTRKNTLLFHSLPIYFNFRLYCSPSLSLSLSLHFSALSFPQFSPHCELFLSLSRQSLLCFFLSVSLSLTLSISLLVFHTYLACCCSNRFQGIQSVPTTHRILHGALVQNIHFSNTFRSPASVPAVPTLKVLPAIHAVLRHMVWAVATSMAAFVSTSLRKIRRAQIPHSTNAPKPLA